MKQDILQIIVPVFNEQECVPEFVRRAAVLRDRVKADADVRVLFINDGSTDSTAEAVAAASAEHSFIRHIGLTRNFGHQAALTAGLDHADADYVALIDGDLQDPPEVIAELYSKAREGYDVVYATRRTRAGETWFKLASARFFYWALGKLCGVRIPPGTGDFRLLSRRVVKTLREMREQHRFIRGLVPWTGFRSCPVLYDRDFRYAGETKFSLGRMTAFALDAVLSFSFAPLRIAVFLGFGILAVATLCGLVLLYLRLFTDMTVPGITAVLLLVLLLGGIQIVMTGVVGEYIGRLFEQSKRRPLYVVDSSDADSPCAGA